MNGPSTIARCDGLASQPAEDRARRRPGCRSPSRSPRRWPRRVQPAARRRPRQRPAGALVREVAAPDHVGGVAARGGAEAPVGAQRPQPVAAALGVDEAAQRAAQQRRGSGSCPARSPPRRTPARAARAGAAASSARPAATTSTIATARRWARRDRRAPARRRAHALGEHATDLLGPSSLRPSRSPRGSPIAPRRSDVSDRSAFSALRQSPSGREVSILTISPGPERRADVAMMGAGCPTPSSSSATTGRARRCCG